MGYHIDEQIQPMERENENMKERDLGNTVIYKTEQLQLKQIMQLQNFQNIGVDEELRCSNGTPLQLVSVAKTQDLYDYHELGSELECRIGEKMKIKTSKDKLD